MWGWKARMARATASTDGMAESSANGLRDFWSLRFDFSFFLMQLQSCICILYLSTSPSKPRFVALHAPVYCARRGFHPCFPPSPSPSPSLFSLSPSLLASRRFNRVVAGSFAVSLAVISSPAWCQLKHYRRLNYRHSPVHSKLSSHRRPSAISQHNHHMPRNQDQ